MPVTADSGTRLNINFGFGIVRVFGALLFWLAATLSSSCFGSDYSLPQRVEVLPVFLVPTDQSPPSQSQKDLFMQHVVLAQARYLAMLGGRTTFALATNQPAVVIGKQTLATYRLAADGGAAIYVSELLNHYGYTRFNCPYVFAILIVNPTDGYPGGGGRTLNHGWNSGGGMMMMSAWALTNTTNFQSTFQHELGHSFGLLHVDAYGYSMTTNNSIMSYNTAHLSNGLTPSPTPGVLIPEDVRALLRNRRVFPYLQFDPVLDTPAGYSMAANYSWLGPMTIPGQVDYPIQATTPFNGLSPVTAMLHNEIKPSTGPGITFDGANMWHSGFSTNGWVYTDITFPLPVSLNKVTIHSQHSGTTYLAERVRIETIVGATISQVFSNSLQQADQTVTFVPTTAQTWRFWFFNSAGYVVVRGLEFFSDSDEIFPPVFPTFNNPPTILAHPTAQTTQQGADVTLTAQAVGSLPLVYQWQRSGTNLNNGGRVSGATNSTLSLNGVVSADGGSYSVLVTNAAGVSVSGSALLTLSGGTTALNITAQPTNQTVLVGTNVSFSVSATGMGPRSYQWRYNGLNLVNALLKRFAAALVRYRRRV